MDYSIIIESNQAIALKQYYRDFGSEVNTKEFNNSKWKIHLPQSIPLEVGDQVSYYSSAIKSKGIGDEGVELIGTANSNDLLTDNKAKIRIGYYISNNWLNNAMLPKSLASLTGFNKELYVLPSTPTFRNSDFKDTYHTYNVPTYTTNFINLHRITWSDYGAPCINSQGEWEKNSAQSLNIQANKINNTADFGFSNTNPTGCGNLCYPVPDNQRLYLGNENWVGWYNNGYDSYHNVAFTKPVDKLFELKTTETEIETNLGFNNPVVIGTNITNSLNTLLFKDEEFVEPKIIDYTYDLMKDIGLTSYKNYFKTFETEQIVDETTKIIPTTFGKMLYDINNGVDNFSINQDVITRSESTIPLPTVEQKARYFWNNMLTGDYHRTIAISKLYQNLNKSKNADTIQTADLDNTAVYTGDIPPDTNYTAMITASYPSSSPYNLGEQIVIFDDLTNFSIPFTSTNKHELKNRVIFRDFQSGGNGYLNGFKIPETTDRHLNLQKYDVIMTNIVANEMNFKMLKSVIDEIEKPSSNSIEIDYTNQDFLDSLYFSFELGNLDDQNSQSIFNISNVLNGFSTGFDYPRVKGGIPVPVCLSCPNSIIPYSLPDLVSNLSGVPNSYLNVDEMWRLPIYAGLFADEDNIKGHTEGSGPVRTFITQIENYRDNKMYEIDFYSRYNEIRNSSNQNLRLPNVGGPLEKFRFLDGDGNYFDDTILKNLDLGCVVAYQNITNTSGIGFRNVGFIGFVCREQISSKDKYNIPLPCEGEFFGIPRSLQNNSLSFSHSWERKVNYDERGVVLVDTNLINGGEIQTGTSDPSLTGKIEGALYTIQPTIHLTINTELSGSHHIQRIVGVRITNNGSHLQGTPVVNFYIGSSLKKMSDFQIQPEIELILGDFRNSYDAGTEENTQPNYPYITIGANNLTCDFDTTTSRMSLSKLHTLMLEGQQTNNLQRYYDASMYYNTEKPVIVADSQSGNEVFKINVKKSYLNSGRCGFTEDIPKEDPNDQLIPITNNAIRSNGILSAISGVSIIDLFAGKKDGTYELLTPFNKVNYSGTLFDKLGFDIKQIIPPFGKQNTFYNKTSHNKYIYSDTNALNMYNNSVKPFTTNCLIDATINQSINTNNINYLMGSLDGSNLLEKSIAQETDKLIAVNLPQKFSYSHLLIYSNIIPKYNYIAGNSINKIGCIGTINRSYEIGDIIFGNQPGIPYIVDKNYILSDIDIELKTELGQAAPIDQGSTIVFKIDKKKPIPLVLEEKIKKK